MGQRLNDALVRTLPVPETGNKIYYDAPNPRGNDHTPGFGLRVTQAGHRSFVLSYRTKQGKARRATIGTYGTWTLLAAREEAKKLKRAIDLGGDPVGELKGQRDAPTAAELFKRFDEQHVCKLRASTAAEYRRLIQKEILPAIGTDKVAGIDFGDIDKLHRAITRRGAPYRANRVLAVISKAFALAVKWKLRSDNPARHVEKNHEESRERYLNEAELDRLLAALDRYSNQIAADAFRLMLLTGARSGEVLKARWAEFDSDFTVWRKPATSTKNKRRNETPLSAPVQEILQRLLARQQIKHVMVFPVLRRVQYAWEKIRADAGIPDVRIHDLRHNHASALVNAGYELPVIAKMLGHARIDTTMRYAHLYPSTMKEAADKVAVLLVGKKKARGKPVIVKGGRP
jgi:integrase